MDTFNEHLAALVAAGLAALLAWLRSWGLDMYRRHILETALDRAAGIALADPAIRAGTEAAMALAAQKGAAYLQRTIPDTLRHLGVGSALVEMVRGEIGLHLAPMVEGKQPAPSTGDDGIRIPRTPVLFEDMPEEMGN